MGVVMGHELSHAFDDQGRQYDAEGNMVDPDPKSDPSSIFLFAYPLSMTNSTLSSLLWRQTGGKMEPLMLIRRRSSASRMSKKYRLPLNNQY